MGVGASGLLIKLENYFSSYLKKSNTMGDNVSFKVYLKTGEEQEEEVRRFVTDKGASTSYDYLVGKLEVVFPQIKTSTFSIHWTDEDGDNVTITSDEELIIALTEMSGPLYKLRVNIKKTKPMVTEQESEASGSSSAVHYGVTCDGCECKPIIGNRYKCVVCDDFDLCETCHAAGKHPGHNMMKITEPGYVFPQRLFKRMQTLQERTKNLSERQQRKEEKKEARGQSCPARGVGPRGRGLFRPFGPMHGGRGGAWAASAVPAFDAMMKGWTGGGMFANNGWSGQNMGSEEHKKAHEELRMRLKLLMNKPMLLLRMLPRLLLMLQQLSMLLLKESICLDLRTISRMLATLLLLLWIPWALMSRLILRLRREGNLVKFPLLRLLPLPQQL